MASPQSYFSQQSKGTLVTGQTISVNKYTVQVERYLSQGGFAHVYLVRTPAPVFGTTHHVLKRIVVVNEAMLTEVKKEVDVMRLLKGHPNIVYLIDAAWHKLPNGTYEVFILMEFCPGGGIIDMMNRRLRERLTEAEILQIFVDVCEGVACMHNLRPALLHRDLKVENILQSSPTSFKLCDFGSATTVSRPPSTTQEIRALEADLNRHTTLQYRAPEMIDVFQRRPVDEKSDVWALGVLLYKLCYYTTPFEEHGPLAILNVQYRIPSYPAYSKQMNELIGSMLQEHGLHRPSVFQLLDHVHRLRGTKSRFKYTIPAPKPLSPIRQTQHKSASHSAVTETVSVALKSLPMTVTPSRAKEAREQVLQAIAPMLDGKGNSNAKPGSSNTKYFEPQIPPMRRGRPGLTRSLSTSKAPTSQNSITPSASKVEKLEKTKNWLENGFVADEDVAWKALSAGGPPPSSAEPADAWEVEETNEAEGKGSSQGFGDDFGNNFLDPSGRDSNASTKPMAAMKRASPSPASHQPIAKIRTRDAFEGLGLAVPSGKPAPTLGEARKLRTGLAIMNSSGFRTNNDGAVKTPLRAPPSPFKSPSPAAPNFGSGTSPSFPSLGASPATKTALHPPVGKDSRSAHPQESLSTENRFPSLEELDANFAAKPFSVSSLNQNDPSPLRRNGSTIRPNTSTFNLSKPEFLSRGSHGREGTRSEQVTGIAMKDSTAAASSNRDIGTEYVRRRDENPSFGGSSSLHSSVESRRNMPRTDRSSLMVKSSLDEMATASSSKADAAHTPKLPALTPSKHVDWLTGDDEHANSASQEIPILRDSPSKRASLIIPKGIPPNQDGVVAEHGETLMPSTSKVPDPLLSSFTSPVVRDESKIGSRTNERRSAPHRRPEESTDVELSSADEDGPEDADGSSFGRMGPKPADTPRRSKKGRHGSVHDLVDLYGGRLTPGGKPSENLIDHEAKLTPQPTKHSAKPPGTPSGSTLTAPLRSPFSFGGNRPPPTGDYEPERKGPSSRGPTPSPSRSRPQSMFLFPSKSSDGVSPNSPAHPAPSAGLVPPEGVKHTRRTSISDMVQHFEGIQAKVLPSPHRPIGRPPPISTDISSHSRTQSSPEKDRTMPKLAAPNNSIASHLPRSPTRTTTNLLHTSSSPMPAPRNDANLRDTENLIPRHSPVKSSFGLQKVLDTSSPPTGECASPGGASPSDKPYQGVGKLIEQWQRKTAESEVNKRGGPGLKRGGHVQHTPR